MTDTNLDRAAKMAVANDWRYAQSITNSTAIRSIQSHAATLDELDAAKAELDAAKAELEAFKRDVSEAVERVLDESGEHIPVAFKPKLSRFILPKPDPLVEVVKACGYATLDAIEPDFAADLNSTAERLGYRLKLERIEHE